MKYAIWRHENALGNSAEQVVNLSSFITEKKDKNPIIFVETKFQFYMALCIPNVKFKNIKYFNKDLDLDRLNVNFLTNKFLHDIYMPDVYFAGLPLVYPSTWKSIRPKKVKLIFPDDIYQNKFDIPKNSIVFHIREKGTYHKRIDGSSSDPQRFVDPKTILELMYLYADMGFKVVQIGDKNQTKAKKHKNILDLCQKDTNILDDLYAINNSLVYLSCDSGIWPIAAGLKRKLVLSNVISVYNTKRRFQKYDLKMINPEIVSWLNLKNTKVLFKNFKNGIFFDNTINELKGAVDYFIHDYFK